MKAQKHLLALTLFASATLSLAQQHPPAVSAPSPTPISKEYLSSAGRFKIFFPFPCTPNELDGPVESKIGQIAFHMLFCVSPTVTYSVMYADYPIDLDSADLVKKALDSAREGSLARVAKEDPQVREEFEISIDG